MHGRFLSQARGKAKQNKNNKGKKKRPPQAPLIFKTGYFPA